MLEGALSLKMVKAIRARGGWAQKIHGGPHQTKGLPDIIAVYHGHGIGLEVKRPGREGTLTNLQAATLRDIRAARGVALMVTTVDEVTAIMDAIDDVYGPETS